MVRDKVLLVDDEEGIRFGIRKFLQQKGIEVIEAETCRAAEAALGASNPDIALLDYCLPDGCAVPDLITRFKEIDPGVPIIVLTAYGSIDLAVDSIKAGAEQFLTKPVELHTLYALMRRMLENQRNRRKQVAGISVRNRSTANPFLASSDRMKKLEEQANKVLFTERPIMILGETGTGKGVLASWLHYNGPRQEEAFVDLNCAALSKDLLDTELFGHEKGAFTGATGDKLGLIEAAHKGTLFLDEIGDMDVQIQPKLLKVLEEKQFRRLGDVHNRSVDVRLVTATHQDLPVLVGEGRFRNDLYFRVSTIKLTIPPLRERAQDIPILADQILDSFSADLGRGNVTLSKDAVAALQAHQWPGNIRELRNILERGVLLCDKNVLTAGDLFSESDIASQIPAPNGKQTLHEIERWHIERVLREEQGNVERAAKVLGVSRSSLYMKTRQYRIAGESKSWTS